MPIYDLRLGQTPYPPLNWDGTPMSTSQAVGDYPAGLRAGVGYPAMSLPEDADAALPAPEEKPYDPAGDGCECGCKVCRDAKVNP